MDSDEAHRGYSRLIWETYKLIALQLILVPILNLTAVVFTSVLGIARKPLHNVICVSIVFEQSVSIRVTKKAVIKKNLEKKEKTNHL